MSRRIVIVGGMGPQASLELHRRIIAGAAEAGAQNNEDYPEILHISIPITDFISSGESEKGFDQLIGALDTLHFRKDDQVIIACNTVHLLLPKLENRYGIKFKSLVEATTQAVKQINAKTVGLLASPTTIKTKLYGDPLNEIGRKVMLPNHEEIDKLERSIRHIIANGAAADVRNDVLPIVKRMRKDGADQVILGCTELSVVFSKTDTKNLVDPLNAICDQIYDGV